MSNAKQNKPIFDSKAKRFAREARKAKRKGITVKKLVKFIKIVAVLVLISWILTTPFGHKIVNLTVKVLFALASGTMTVASSLVG